MCGRFTLSSNLDDLQARFGFEARDLEYRPSYNIAPTQHVMVVSVDSQYGNRRAEFMRWGLVPFWAKDLKIGARMINAQAETAARREFPTIFARHHFSMLRVIEFKSQRDADEFMRGLPK